MDNAIKKLEDMLNARNFVPLPEFEGYNPFQMTQILYFLFGEKSPLKINPDFDFSKIPIVQMVHYLLKAVEPGLKLTSSGYLPPKIVKDLYGMKYICEDCIDGGIVKLRTESDSLSVSLARIITDLSGMIKKRSNALFLTTSGKACLENKNELLKKAFETFIYKFNWAYNDGYGENKIGQVGAGFSMILLHKYGAEFKTDRFYAEKFFAAFPQILGESQCDLIRAIHCYSLRTFDRFLDYFGFIEIQKEKKYDAEKFVRKTPLFDEIINISKS
jgi:hypothetical protein